MSKKAVVIVSFGTTVPETRVKTFDKFEEKVRRAYPEYDVFQAYTSRIVVKRIMDNEGKRVLTEKGIMYQLALEGYDEVVLQPLHIIPGAEYSKVLHLAVKWRRENIFKKIYVGRPLLRFIGQEGERPDDYQILLEALRESVPLEKNKALLLVGHGTFHSSQTAYAALQLKARQIGYQNVWVGTIEGFPEWDSYLDEMRDKGITNICVKPLFFVAGDHVQNDLFGDEDDAVATSLRAAGFVVEEDQTALGEADEILDIYLQHLDDALQENYVHRPADRPSIPNVI